MTTDQFPRAWSALLIERHGPILELGRSFTEGWPNKGCQA